MATTAYVYRVIGLHDVVKCDIMDMILWFAADESIYQHFEIQTLQLAFKHTEECIDYRFDVFALTYVNPPGEPLEFGARDHELLENGRWRSHSVASGVYLIGLNPIDIRE